MVLTKIKILWVLGFFRARTETNTCLPDPSITGVFFLRFYLFIFRERGREGEREGEKYQCVAASRAPPTGDLACNPGVCPDWESNLERFGSQASTQSTEPHQPGLEHSFHSAVLLACQEAGEREENRKSLGPTGRAPSDFLPGHS